MLPVRNRLVLPYVLSGLLILLLLGSSVAGLLYGDRGLYDSYPADLAGLMGQDVVTLTVVVPLLLAGMWLTVRSSTRGLLLWAGALLWTVYFYFFYVVGGFNALFLAYIGIVSASLFGLLSLLFSVDPKALKARFDAHTPVRLIGGFLTSIAILFAIMWVGMILASLASGTRPEEVTREVVIIDLAMMLPLLFYGGLRLWRRAPWGYVLGGLLLVKTATTGLTMAFTTVLGAWWAGTVDPFQAFLLVHIQATS